MTDINRRRLLRGCGAGIGLATIPGAVAADDGERSESEGLTINRRAANTDENGRDVHILDITNNEKQERKRFVGVVGREGSAVHLTEVNEPKFRAVASVVDSDVSATDSTVGTESVDDGVRISADDVTVLADRPIIQRSDVYRDTNGECSAYDYTHEWAAVTAEFPNAVGDIGWGSVAAGLIYIVGSANVPAIAGALLVTAITAVAGIGAYVTNTYSLTFGAPEFDKSAAGWTQTLYGVQIDGGYHKSKGQMPVVMTYPTHPARLA
jgi:hypothetical protein